MGEADRCADQPETLNGVTDTDGLQAGFVDALRGKRVDDRLRPTLRQTLIVRIAAHVIGMADDKYLDLLL